MNNDIKLDNKELPVDDMKKYKVIYENDKMTNGGFIDALFLVSFIATGFLWMYIAITIK